MDDDSATTIMSRPTPSAPSAPSTKPERPLKESKQSIPSQTSVSKPKGKLKDTDTEKSKQAVGKNTMKSKEVSPEVPGKVMNDGVVSSAAEAHGTSQSPHMPHVPQQFMNLQSLFDSPVPLRSNIPTVNSQKYKISLGSGRGSIKQVCSPEITVSQLVAILLLNRLLPLRMDLSGNLTSCYRVLDKGTLTSGQRRLNSFERQTVMLGSVPSRTLLLPIEVHTSDGVTRFNSPVNWIVSMGSMIDYIVSWLRIPNAGWTVYINDHRMDVHDVLFDVYAEGKPCTIILKQSNK